MFFVPVTYLDADHLGEDHPRAWIAVETSSGSSLPPLLAS